MANPWFRLYSKITADPKVEFLSFEDQRHFVWILCLKNEGYLDENLPNEEMFERMIARKLGLQGEAFSNAKTRLMNVGLIDENWQPIAWEKSQFISDSDPTRAERQRRFREKTKKEQESYKNVTDRNALRNGRVTQLDTDTDTDTEVNPIDTNVSIVMNEKPIHDEMKQEIILDSEPLKIDSDIPDCPHKEIIDCYKNVLPEAIHPRTWDGARMAALKSRWRESKNRQSIDWWRRFFEYIRQSDFLMGRALALNRQPFEIRLDWIVKKENFNKIIDGVYENRQRTV